jgi:tartrate dehydratase beta subunit/fumarate hydratase class I family protein
MSISPMVGGVERRGDDEIRHAACIYSTSVHSILRFIGARIEDRSCIRYAPLGLFKAMFHIEVRERFTS